MARKKPTEKRKTTARKPGRTKRSKATMAWVERRCNAYIKPPNNHPDYLTRLASALSANLQIADSQSVVVDGNQGIAVAKEQCVQTGGNQYHYIGADQNVRVDNNQHVAIGGDQLIQVGQDYRMQTGHDLGVDVGNDYNLRVAKKLDIVCGDEITVTVGKSRVRLMSNGHIEIFGNVIDILSTNELNIEGPKVRIRGNLSLRLEGNETMIV